MRKLTAINTHSMSVRQAPKPSKNTPAKYLEDVTVWAQRKQLCDSWRQGRQDSWLFCSSSDVPCFLGCAFPEETTCGSGGL